jgi:hypothetical protein
LRTEFPDHGGDTPARDLGNIGTDLMIEVIRHSGRSTKPLIRRP